MVKIQEASQIMLIKLPQATIKRQCEPLILITSPQWCEP